MPQPARRREPDPTLDGVWAVLATPFGPDGAVDHGALAAETEWLAGLGIRGVVANGVTSEAHKLSHEERCQAAETVRNALPEGLGLVVGCLEPSLPLVRNAAARAEKLGPTAVMVWPGFRPSASAALVEAMQVAAAEASRAPVILQDAAFFGPAPLEPCDIVEIAKRSRDLCAVKVEAPPSAQRMNTIRQQAGESVFLIGGQGGRYLPLEYEVGAGAFFIGPGFPELYLPIVRELQAGAELPESWRRLVPLLDFMFQSAEFAVACYKRLLVARGVLALSNPRGPGVTLHRVEEQHLLRLAGELGIV